MTPAEVVATIRQVAAERGFPDVDLLLATAFQESGFDALAAGDRDKRNVPHSWGPFQENDGGRGAGIPIVGRTDVRAATNRAIDEFLAVRARHPDVSRGAWAALAQRPADQSGYAANINRMLSGHDRAFSAAAGASPAGAGAAPPGAASASPAPVSVAAADAPDWLQQSWAAGGTFGRSAGRAGPSGAGAPAATPRGAAPPGFAAQAPTGAAGGMVWPVAGQRAGAVNNPFGGVQSRAAGTTVALPASNVGADLTGRYGQDVVAPVSGTVIAVYDAPNETDRNLNSGWGGMTLLRGDDGFTYRLSHARPGSLGTQVGQRVQAGQYLQQIGVSGNTTGPHLDFEKFDRPGHFVDPVATMGQAVATVQRGARGAADAAAGAWKVVESEAPDWLKQAWSAGSTLGKDAGVASQAVRDRATTAVASAASSVADTADRALKVVEDVTPDWLKQAWEAGSTFGR